LNVRHRIPVLRESHRPAEDRALRFDKDARGFAYLFALDAATFRDLFPTNFFERRGKLREARGVLVDEFMIEHFARTPRFLRHHFFTDALQERDIAVDANL
jgi:hypothetical protein